MRQPVRHRCSPCATSRVSSSNIEEFLKTTAKEPGSASAQQRAVRQGQPMRLNARAVRSADSSRAVSRREYRRTQTDVPRNAFKHTTLGRRLTRLI